MNGSAISISVIVPAYNCKKHINSCLGSVIVACANLGNTYQVSREIFMDDD